jgi:hypothetical protein
VPICATHLNDLADQVIAGYPDATQTVPVGLQFVRLATVRHARPNDAMHKDPSPSSECDNIAEARFIFAMSDDDLVAVPEHWRHAITLEHEGRAHAAPAPEIQQGQLAGFRHHGPASVCLQAP